jgi:hypothetical protein
LRRSISSSASKVLAPFFVSLDLRRKSGELFP